MVSPDAPPDPYGGIGTYLEGLLDALSSKDADVHLVGTSRHRNVSAGRPPPGPGPAPHCPVGCWAWPSSSPG